jgi:hypothetical protein
VSHFEKEAKTGADQHSRQGFADLLLAFEGKFQPGLEAQGVRVAVQTLLEAPRVEEQKASIRLTLDNGTTVTLESLDDRLLYSLLPVLAKYEPERADRILRERPQLKIALEKGGAITSEEAVVVKGEPNQAPQRIEAVARRELAWQRAESITEMAGRDTDGALQLLAEIPDESARAAALANAAAALAREDSKRAQTLMAESLSRFEKVENPAARLRVLVAILRAHARFGDSVHVGETYQEVLELGEELARRETASAPDLPLFVTASFQRLAAATKHAASFDADAALLQLSRLENTLLQSHLMIEVARTVVELQRQ